MFTSCDAGFVTMLKILKIILKWCRIGSLTGNIKRGCAESIWWGTQYRETFSSHTRNTPPQDLPLVMITTHSYGSKLTGDTINTYWYTYCLVILLSSESFSESATFFHTQNPRPFDINEYIPIALKRQKLLFWDLVRIWTVNAILAHNVVGLMLQETFPSSYW